MLDVLTERITNEKSFIVNTSPANFATAILCIKAAAKRRNVDVSTLVIGQKIFVERR
jgi:hypothetical protein